MWVRGIFGLVEGIAVTQLISITKNAMSDPFTMVMYRGAETDLNVEV